MDKISYALGLSMGHNFRQTGIEVLNVEDFAAGIRAVYAGEKPAMSYEEAKNVVNDFFDELQQKQHRLNRELGQKFLEENSKDPDVKVTSSGLQYKIVKQGDGPKPRADQKVTVHYAGRLIDGTVFDSSIERGEPAVFAVNQVIPGWVEALQMMPEGSQWQLYIPSELAYGKHGAGQIIGPDATLIFDVQLIKVG